MQKRPAKCQNAKENSQMKKRKRGQTKVKYTVRQPKVKIQERKAKRGK